MLTVVFGLTAALGWGLHDFLIQPVARKAGPYTALFWVVLASAAILMGAALAIDGLPSGSAEWRSVAIAAGGGVTYVISAAALLRGLAVGNLSLVTPLVALSGGVGAVVAIILGETVSLLAAIAIPLAIVGAVLASVVSTPSGEQAGESATEDAVYDPAGDQQGAEGPRMALSAVGAVLVSAESADAAGAERADSATGAHPADPAAEVAPPRRVQAAAGAGWALLSALLFGTTFVIYGYADEVSSVTAAAWGRLTGLAVYLPLALLAVPLHMPRPLYQRVVACAVLDSIAYVAIAAGLARGPVAVASALSAQFATVALVLGVIVLHERPTRVQLVGLLFTIAAVVLFSLAVA